MNGVESDPEEASAEETLLLCARQGQCDILRALLENIKSGTVRADINCKGTNRANRGWTPLHLASYFGQLEVVQLLLQHGANVSSVNNVGDTPLHRAAYTNRVDVVTELLTHGADVTAINAEGHVPKAVTNNAEIIKLIEAAEQTEESRLEEEFLAAIRLGLVDRVETLVSDGHLVQCTDSFGNSPLHVAAQMGQKEVAVLLLQHGVDSTVKNKQGLQAFEVAKNDQMKQLLHVQPRQDARKVPKRFEGLLIRKRFMGNTPVWTVLERGVLSYFKSRGDASTGTKRKGMKYLDEADLMPHKHLDNDFMIEFSEGTSHRLAIDSKTTDLRVGRNRATGEIITRQMWLDSLQEHIEYNTHYMHKGSKTASQEDNPLTSMTDSFKRAQAHQNVLDRQVTQLADFLTQSQDDRKQGYLDKLEAELQKTVKYAKDMTSSLGSCLSLFEQQEEERQKKVHEEMEKNRVLQESLHALAVEHHELEKTYSFSLRGRTCSQDDLFFDCDDFDDVDVHLPISPKLRGSFVSDAFSFKSCQFDVDKESDDEEGANSDGKKSLDLHLGGRSSLPVPMFDRNDFSFWSILKQCIGKELSKITMPVVFNEPLTFLQRITEYLEYSTLLDLATQQENPADRMMYVAAFAVSAISSNWDRIGKPFNPLLGETYQLDRPDLGFRLVCEQVCHHPPISAFHIESKHFKFHGSIHPKLKFWGKSVEISPKGTITLELTDYGEVYTWQNVNCCVHNVIVGKIWIEHTGTMEVINHKTKHKAVLNFKQGGWFGKDLHKIEGNIYDPNKRKVKALYGSWVYDLFGVDQDKYDDYMKTKQESPKHMVSENGSKSDVEDNIPTHHFSTFNLEIPDQVALWRTTQRPEGSDKYFSFTLFAMGLNELKAEMLQTLPPTDSRLRPDVRILEEGNIDLAGEEKNRLEEKQRLARRERKKRKEEWVPVWFKLGTNPVTDKEDWLYTSKYWDKDWSRCPDIF